MTLDNQEPYFVIGHRNPDTDAICAAIGYAAYLREQEKMQAVPLRCGAVPERVQWVLEQAGMPEPALVTDVRTTAGLICDRGTPCVRETDTFLSVYNAMQESGMEAVAVVTESGEISGVLDFTLMMRLLMPREAVGGRTAKTVVVSSAKMLESLKGKSLGADLTENEESLTMFVGASSSKTIRSAIKRYQEQGVMDRHLVICGDRPQLMRAAIENGARVLIVTSNCEFPEDLEQRAKEAGVVVISCTYDTATTVQLVRCSRIVGSALGGEFLYVEEDEAVSELKKRLSAMPQELFPVVKTGTRQLLGVFTKADLVDPPRTRIVMVDHNEFSQAVRGIEEADVKIVVDHHRLGGNIISRDPIFFLNEPVGSSSTLIARKFRDNNTPMSKGVAMCLCAGMISDTLNLTSPTTTNEDRMLLQWLCERGGVDALKFTRDFFAAGSLIMNGTDDELVQTDRKEFLEGGKKISISQVEEMGLQGLDERIEGIRSNLKLLNAKHDYDVSLVAVTDIAEHVSIVVAVGDEKIINKIRFEHLPNGTMLANGVVSRKKQIFPALCDAIKEAAGTIG